MNKYSNILKMFLWNDKTVFCFFFALNHFNLYWLQLLFDCFQYSTYKLRGTTETHILKQLRLAPGELFLRGICIRWPSCSGSPERTGQLWTKRFFEKSWIWKKGMKEYRFCIGSKCRVPQMTKVAHSKLEASTEEYTKKKKKP